MTIAWTLEELLPHDHPMILIDDVVEPPDGGLVSRVRISEDRPFYLSRLGVPSYAGIEYIAQTVAALVGLRALRTGNPVKLGYLLGARRFSATAPYFPLGALLTTRVSSEFESEQIASYRGEVWNDQQQIIETSITLYSGSLAERINE